MLKKKNWSKQRQWTKKWSDEWNIEINRIKKNKKLLWFQAVAYEKNEHFMSYSPLFGEFYTVKMKLNSSVII